MKTLTLLLATAALVTIAALATKTDGQTHAYRHVVEADFQVEPLAGPDYIRILRVWSDGRVDIVSGYIEGEPGSGDCSLFDVCYGEVSP